MNMTYCKCHIDIRGRHKWKKQSITYINGGGDFVQRQNTVCDFSSSYSWVVLTPIEQSIKRKIEAAVTPLKDWDIKIYRGFLPVAMMLS